MTLRENIRDWLLRHPKINPYKYSRERIFQPYKVLTGSSRVLPDFIILGAPRCGTTSLYYNLINHPNIFPGSGKSAEFFTKNFDKGINYYKSHFVTNSTKNHIIKIKQEKFVAGEATPTCLAHPISAERIAATIPNIKMIAILRNPIDRAYSHYNYHVVRNEAKFSSFEDAIEYEMDIFKKGWQDRIDRNSIDPEYSYLYTSMYVEHFWIFMNYFPREQFLILKMEDFNKNFEGILQQVFEFLELPNLIIKNPKKLNAVPYDTIIKTTRKSLLEFFQPYNKQLEDFLKMKFDWNY